MKKIATLLTLAIALGLLFSFVSCGEKEEPRYTITMEEYEKLRENINCTAKYENYYGEGKSITYIEKCANGVVCICGNDFPNDPFTSGSTGTTWQTAKTSQKSTGPKNEVVDYPANSPKATPIAPNEPESDDIPLMSVGSFSTAFENITTIASFKPISVIVVGSSITSGFIVDYPYNGSVSVGASDFLSRLLCVGTYQDSEGNTYKYSDYTDNTSMGICTKIYNKENYVELTVQDENKEKTVKWVKLSDYGESAIGQKFEDLVFDEQEKAYVYSLVDKENGRSIKSYSYFENGNLVKSIAFFSYAESGNEVYDVSKLTPSSPYVSKDYQTSVGTYYDHGETTVEGHSFSPEDIITKVKK